MGEKTGEHKVKKCQSHHDDKYPWAYYKNKSWVKRRDLTGQWLTGRQKTHQHSCLNQGVETLPDHYNNTITLYTYIISTRQTENQQKANYLEVHLIILVKSTNRHIYMHM